VGGVPARTYEVFYVAGKQFRKLVAENGRPSRPDEALKEERRVAKAVREHREQHPGRRPPSSRGTTT
jgi:hypothetical protein